MSPAAWNARRARSNIEPAKSIAPAALRRLGGDASEERSRAEDERASGDAPAAMARPACAALRAEAPLEQERREEQARVERESVQGRREQSAGERAVAQHGKIHGRLAGLALADDEERGEQCGGDQEDRIVPARQLERDHRAGEETRHRLDRALAPRTISEFEMARNEPQAEQPERHVDEEDRRPAIGR